MLYFECNKKNTIEGACWIMQNVKELSIREMQRVSGGGWQTMSFTPNMECWNGVLKTGNCRVKWDVVANQAVNNVTSAMIGGFGRGR